MKYILYILIALASFQEDSALFVENWEHSIRLAIEKQQARSNSIATRNELLELLSFMQTEKLNPNLKKGDNIRLDFVHYVQNEDSQALNEGVILEQITSGEQTTITYFLLRKSAKNYSVITYNYDYGWHTSKKAKLSLVYVQNLLSNTRCFPHGSNRENIIVTKFSRDGKDFASQFYTQYSLCLSLDTLNNL